MNGPSPAGFAAAVAFLALWALTDSAVAKPRIPRPPSLPFTLHLHHRPLPIPIREQDGRFWVPLPDLLPHLSVEWTRTDGRYEIFAPGVLQPHDEPTPSPLMVNGRSVTKGVRVEGKTILVSLGDLAPLLGYVFTANRQTGIADLFRPRAPSAQAPTASPLTAAPPPSTETAPPPAEEEEPLSLEGFHYREEINTREVRAFVTVRNVSRRPVSGIVVTAQYLDGNRVPIVTQRRVVGELAPGQTRDLDFFWINTTNIWVKVDLAVDWEGKKAPR